MEDLIARLVAATGLDASLLTQASGMILAFLEKEGPAGAVAQVVEAIPGAREVVNAAMNAEGASGGGLMGMLGGIMGHMSGGIAGLGAQLMGLGLDIGQIQTLAKALLDHASQVAGPETVQTIVREVPGLGQFL